MALAIALTAACSQERHESAGIAPGEIKKWNDPNFDIIGVGAYNYTDHDIYDVFILPPDKNDIAFAADASGAPATRRGAQRWGLHGASGANLAWDHRWATPKQFKVWWFRIVDKDAYSASAGKYDPYSTKSTIPGGAWCEGTLTVAHAPVRGRGGDLVIHYYPDGHIEGDVMEVEGDASRVSIQDRDRLPTLQDRPCVKEIANPYYGKKKPTAMY